MAFDENCLVRSFADLELTGAPANATGINSSLFDVYRVALECDARLVELALAKADIGDTVQLVSGARKFRVDALRAVGALGHASLRSGTPSLGSSVGSQGSAGSGSNGSDGSTGGSVGTSTLRGILHARALGRHTALARLPPGLCYLRGASAAHAEELVDVAKKYPTTAKLLSRPRSWFNSDAALSTLVVKGKGDHKHVAEGNGAVKLSDHFRDAAMGRDWPVGSLGASYVARWPSRPRSSDELIAVRLGGSPSEEYPQWLSRHGDGGKGVCFLCTLENACRANGEYATEDCWKSSSPGSAGSAEKWMGHVARDGCGKCGLLPIPKKDKKAHLAARCAARYLVRGRDDSCLPLTCTEDSRARAECLLAHGMAEQFDHLDLPELPLVADRSRLGVYSCSGHSADSWFSRPVMVSSAGGVQAGGSVAASPGAVNDSSVAAPWRELISSFVPSASFPEGPVNLVSVGFGPTMFTRRCDGDGISVLLAFSKSTGGLLGYLPVDPSADTSRVWDVVSGTMVDGGMSKMFPASSADGAAAGSEVVTHNPFTFFASFLRMGADVSNGLSLEFRHYCLRRGVPSPSAGGF